MFAPIPLDTWKSEIQLSSGIIIMFELIRSLNSRAEIVLIEIEFICFVVFHDCDWNHMRFASLLNSGNLQGLGKYRYICFLESKFCQAFIFAEFI